MSHNQQEEKADWTRQPMRLIGFDDEQTPDQLIAERIGLELFHAHGIWTNVTHKTTRFCGDSGRAVSWVRTRLDVLREPEKGVNPMWTRERNESWDFPTQKHPAFGVPENPSRYDVGPWAFGPYATLKVKPPMRTPFFKICVWSDCPPDAALLSFYDLVVDASSADVSVIVERIVSEKEHDEIWGV